VKAQRTIAVVMILGSSLLVALTSGDIAFPAILCMLGMVGLQGRFTWGIRPERRFITPLLLLLLAVLFSIHCDLANPPSDMIAAFAWQTIARYFLSCMILILFLRSRQRPAPPETGTRPWERTLAPLSPSLGLFHMASALASGQVLLLDDRYLAFRLVELFSVLMVVLYASCAVQSPCLPQGPAHQERRRRLSLHGSCLVLLVVATNLGWVGGSVLYSRVESLNLLPTWLWRANVPLDTSAAGVSQVGFSTSGKLSGVLAIMEDTNPEPVLRITSTASPGYLRAMAFITYRPSEWYEGGNRSHVYPDESRLIGRMNLFRLSDREANREMTVRHESTVIDALFTPLGVCFIEAPFDSLSRDDDDGTIRAEKTRANLTYRIDYSTSSSIHPPSADQIRRMLNPSSQLDSRIRHRAKGIFRNCTTTAEKIEAVTRYFRTNYTYALGLGVPVDQDPLTYFLEEASTGYCEYFATGAAILLRLADVPTRYVTGFLVTERDADGKSWVARNMDAHAWVEAWDQEHNTWVIVEATSQEDLAGNSLTHSWLENGSGTRVLLARLLQAVYDYGLLGILGWFFEVYSLQTAAAVSLAFVGAAVSLAQLRRRRRSHDLTSWQAALSPELLALHKMLATMDRKARFAGRRQPHETLHAFAERIRRSSKNPDSEAGGPGPQDGGQGPEAVLPASNFPLHTSHLPPCGIADWYLAYAGLRYCGSISPERVAELQHLAQRLRGAS
jgi:transglutaminase-like putative cysteine protease